MLNLSVPGYGDDSAFIGFSSQHDVANQARLGAEARKADGERRQQMAELGWQAPDTGSDSLSWFGRPVRDPDHTTLQDLVPRVTATLQRMFGATDPLEVVFTAAAYSTTYGRSLTYLDAEIGLDRFDAGTDLQ